MHIICIAIGVLSTLSLICGGLLGYASKRCLVEKDPIINDIDTLLPQSQCGQCGYPGCLPYANAISVHNEHINKCVPGGTETMLQIAEILNIEPEPIEDSITKQYQHSIAWINENNCIGCTKCMQVCPVDAIIGSKRVIHTVFSDICTGCKICISHCPTHCIEMRPLTTKPHYWQ
ncbi:electron transport complex subunit RsxB [Candidatus Erwinia haradaeae]|uniref:Ion-translocating oxidoreductase complex subunit B n=1 Tax=Candidatus Erwinia haradaeae TaxID=1922217 RepID=A0A803FSU6_9GAMM|nr:electron transport complex subunit RsxB [Candidatus Erwinia haradaeae]VFP87162.1 Electron transport complex subunit RsxB [Candidatus Erwinia haradaeae]